MRLQYIQEQSRQTILPGLELFYEHPPFPAALILAITLDSGIHPLDHVGNHIVLAVFVEDLMEQVPVNLQGLVGGSGIFEEDHAVIHAHQAVLFAVGHEDGISEGLHALGEPLLTVLQRID